MSNFDSIAADLHDCLRGDILVYNLASSRKFTVEVFLWLPFRSQGMPGPVMVTTTEVSEQETLT